MDNIKSLFIIPTFTQKQHDLYEKYSICGKEYPLEKDFQERIDNELNDVRSHFPIIIPQNVIYSLNCVLQAYYNFYIYYIKIHRIEHAKYSYRSTPKKHVKQLSELAFSQLDSARDSLKQVIIKEHVNDYDELILLRSKSIQ